MSLEPFREVWFCDFEFRAPNGERPDPVCMVAREWRSGRLIWLWREELRTHGEAPFPVGPESLFVAYYASAELGCFLALDWPMPKRILDLFVEFRNLTNGLETPCGSGLLGALAYFGLDAIGAADKESMRSLAMREGSHTGEEKTALLDYCQTDVDALARLLPAMLPKIDMPRALLRGRYMGAVAQMEWTGTPIDVDMLMTLRERWASIQGQLVERVDAGYGVYESATGTPGRYSFSSARFAEYLGRNNIPWPRLSSGSLALDEDAFREMARSYPALSPLRELRHSLGELRVFDLAVGSDGRNRCLLSPFRARTGRNQPSNTRFVFGPSVWIRSLIRPGPGRALAYIDFEQQEFAIAAALSKDCSMMDAYVSGDPYLAFAIQAGAAPIGATKQTHKEVRELFKICALAVQYGMGEESLARRIGQSPAHARELLRLHRATYPKFWSWSEGAVNHAMLRGWLQTVYGWRVRVGTDANPRSLANFPVQANGAEMLRLACCLLTEAGIEVCAPVHDAVLVEGPADEIEEIVARAGRLMTGASAIILGGFPVRTDAKLVRCPDHYSDPRGEKMWSIVQEIIASESVPKWGTLGNRTEVEPARFKDTPPVPETGRYLPVSGTPA